MSLHSTRTICCNTSLVHLKIVPAQFVVVRIHTQNFRVKVKADDFKHIMSLRRADFSEDWVTAEIVTAKRFNVEISRISQSVRNFVCIKLEIQTLGSLTKTDKKYPIVVYPKVRFYYPLQYFCMFKNFIIQLESVDIINNYLLYLLYNVYWEKGTRPEPRICYKVW